ncbi:MAG: prepilin-type N-terminal cleavage/methylation domain-containing protein [Sulfurimonas sp.]|jgi:prepilin-type N-terminal cleavage/methylation domain-containing protein
MKKAFTMIELVFVLVVIGILAAVMIPNMQSTKLREAAIQVVSHIRYTQHLAMVDDKFDSKDNDWYQERWRIRFKKDLVYSILTPSGTTSNVWAYTIYSDNSHDGNPNLSEMAINPLNANQYLSGGYNDTLHLDDEKSMKEMRLGTKYGIHEVSFSGGCRSDILYIYFDHLGRPFNSMNTTSPYELASTGWHKLLTSECKISLCEGTCTGTSSDTEVVISIHPETGYTCILDSSGECI